MEVGIMSLTLDDIREAYRKLGPPPPKIKGSPYICAGNAYKITYKNPLTKRMEEVIFINKEELELLMEEE
jgi:hypothetical protein